jgi:antagonist of KipI
MSITLLSKGILTTVQDLGRFGARRYGINPGGAMDTRAVRLINILLGNDQNEAVLEMHYPAPQITFDHDTIFALGGAEFAARLDGERVENWRPYFAAAGAVLSFHDKQMGTRCYLGIRGGFAIENWLGSAATNLKAQSGGFEGRALQKGDRLKGKGEGRSISNSKFRFYISPNLVPYYNSFPTVRVIPGAEYYLLDEAAKAEFVGQNFSIGLQSDRMGFRLEGVPLKLETPHEFISSAVGFGTIQLLPDGQLIVLMADHQTTGGYPRLAHVITEDLPLVGQLGARDGVGFHVVDLAEAENALLESENELHLLRVALKQKWA